MIHCYCHQILLSFPLFLIENLQWILLFSTSKPATGRAALCCRHSQTFRAFAEVMWHWNLILCDFFFFFFPPSPFGCSPRTYVKTQDYRCGGVLHCWTAEMTSQSRRFVYQIYLFMLHGSKRPHFLFFKKTKTQEKAAAVVLVLQRSKDYFFQSCSKMSKPLNCACQDSAQFNHM